MQSIMRYLRYTCMVENEEYARFGPKYRKHLPKSTDSSLLHTSSSSRSSLSPDTSFDAFLRSHTVDAMDPYVASLDDNPEALFDILTIQSMHERYSDSEKTEVSNESFVDVALVTDKDFENFVREFPIDDSISECFATNSLDGAPSSINSNYRQSQPRPNKLKKKHIPNGTHDNHILSDDDSKSSDSKKSKLGNLFHRKPKVKDQHKNAHNVDGQNDVQGGETAIGVKADREDASRSQSSSRKLPPLPKIKGGSSAGSTKGSMDSRRSKSSSQQEMKYWFTIIDAEDDEDKIIQTLMSWPMERLRKLRDGQGNTLLHRAAMVDKTKVITELGTRFPELIYDLNYDRLSSLDVSVQSGKVTAMNALLNLQYGDEVPPTERVGKLLEVAAKKGECGCVGKLLSFLSREHGGQLILPKNSSGDTAAHIAAAHGHVACLHVLIEQGYTGWTENAEGLHPLHVAVHHNQMACYHFLLLHQCCKCLLRDHRADGLTVRRLQSSKITTQSAIEQLEQRLVRHQKNVLDTLTTSAETQLTITDSLTSIYRKLEGLLDGMGTDKGGQLRTQLDNIRAEGERLQDLFEFSPLASTNELLSKVLNDFSLLSIESDRPEGEGVCVEPSSTAFILNVAEEVQKILPSSKNVPSDVDSIINTVLSSPDIYKDGQTQRQEPVCAPIEVLSTKSKDHADVTEVAREDKVKPREKEVKFSNVLPTNRPPEQHSERQLVVRDTPMYADRYTSRQLQNRMFPHVDQESVCSNTLTLTSGITGTEHTSDWTSRVDTLSAESTDSESDWWEDTRRSAPRWRHRSADEEEDTFYDEDIPFSNNIVLNLENEDASDDVLREHRLAQHLQAMKRFNTERTDLVETVVTASGRRLGGRVRPDPSYIQNPDPRLSHHRYMQQTVKSDSLRNRKLKERQRSKIKLFSEEDIQGPSELTQSEFLDSYGRTAGEFARKTDKHEKRWDEVSLTDADEARENDKAWYEMSEDEESIIQTWRSDEEDNQSPDYRQFTS
ncbi:LOW QUALITY PROTEIN: uncharacterized protein LOC117314942 [Pecten maximus]|uniref:LOW QUALITY PROTEIN: uncharacterized protein LOC117314942 n=1 Tax=Pecten maximus TaxID=6579 RepID=UPI001458E3EF|nr:LOW QUALITY PROTEIN: uncharacterized protein LOC117314942 [Pecten maximus]